MNKRHSPPRKHSPPNKDSADHAPRWPLSLGGHGWSCGAWGGVVYPKRTPRTEWLHWYSKTYNAVEGNSSFYALPDEAIFRRWAEQTVPGFQFCCKFPREISHDLMLQNCRQPLRDFLSRLEILANADRLGPTFLQLGPRFGPSSFETLSRFLKQLPREMPWAVELRHSSWFDDPKSASQSRASTKIESQSKGSPLAHENRVNELLERLSIDKVLFDSRPLFQSPPDDQTEVISQGKKPRTPIRQTVTGRNPMLRIVGRNQTHKSQRFFEQWAPIVARWIDEGLHPYVFVHAPDDTRAPDLAQRFLQALQKHLPERYLDVPRPPRPDRQLSLLDESID